MYSGVEPVQDVTLLKKSKYKCTYRRTYQRLYKRTYKGTCKSMYKSTCWTGIQNDVLWYVLLYVL